MLTTASLVADVDPTAVGKMCVTYKRRKVNRTTYLEFKVNLRHIGEGLRWHRPLEYVILQRSIIMRGKENSASNERETETKGIKEIGKRAKAPVQLWGSSR